MPITAGDWNITIVGFWNRAIYTPAGISRRLFRLAATTPVQVLIPIDQPAPYQVQHEGLTVSVGSDRLVVQPDRASFEGMVSAMEIGRRALDDLPHTPLLAAGFNLRYMSDGPVGALGEITANDWDKRLSDEGFVIQEWTVTRSVRRQNGRINVTVTQKEDLTFSMLLNFHLQSDDVSRLRAWIDIPAADIQREVEHILQKGMGLQADEVTYG
jgi:hypothetical protein